MYQALYDSPLWIPSIPVLVAAVLLVRAAIGYGRGARAFTAVFALLIAQDAWLNGALSPLAPEGAGATLTAVVFVVLGDLRYFYAQRRFAGAPVARALKIAVPLSLLVPIASQLGVRLPFPELPLRWLFLLYELGMLLCVSVDWALHRRQHSSSLARFELTQYTLWAAADLLLLAGVEAAYLLRIVANLLYYAAFVPLAAHVLAAAARRRSLQQPT